VRRPLTIALQFAVSGGLIAYLLWLVDVQRTVDLIVSSDPLWLLASLGIFVATTWGLSWRWQILLASKGIAEPLGWLTKLYFVNYAVGQVLPTTIGGDAVRILDHARRRPNVKGEVAAAVLMDRVVGAAGTLVMVALGLAVAVGRYGDIGLYVWVEVGSLAVLAVAVTLLFSRRIGEQLLERVFPLGRRLRVEGPLRSVYVAMHGYRDRRRALAAALAATIVVQVPRIVAVWMCGKAVGIDLSPLPYLVLGPLIILVTMVPFTINGLGVREAFFVAFLARFNVSYDAAFATGFLFYVVIVVTSIPGGVILLWRSLRTAPAV
jgi:glycosyltransferase 2 family protein